MSGAGAPRGRGRPPLSPEEWRRLEPQVDALLDLPPGNRAQLLTELSGGDTTRRAELERLVAECEREYPLLDRPLAGRPSLAVADEEIPPMPGSLAGRYSVIREVGRGGMAIVYLARDLKHGRDVAVKVVRPSLAAALGRVRFLREIEIAARLRHPHIMPLYDSGEVPSGSGPCRRGDPCAPLLYYVMPYEPGQSLRERLAHDGPLPVDDVVRILRDVCEALAHAHQHGIVHRDIKPDNVLLSGGHAVVTDFGVAGAVSAATVEPTLVGGSTAVGTPTYMAPEQAAGHGEVDHRADIHAVGVLAYELLAGRLPLVHGAARSTRVPDLAGELASIRADVPDALAVLIARCMAAQPDDRWQCADDLLAALASSVAVTDAVAARRTRIAWTIAGGVGAAMLMVVTIVSLQPGRDGAGQPPVVIGRANQLTSERGLEVQPTLSADGRYIAYAVGNSMHMRIAVRPTVGGPARWLTTDTSANQWSPRWSPDGGRLLFLSHGGVYSVPARGTPVRREIADRPGAIVRSATWSPDGREIAYVRGDSLLARDVGTRVTRLITTGADLHSCRWSPDGTRIACVAGNSFHVTVGAVSGIGSMFGNLAPSRIVLVASAGGRPVDVTDGGSLHQSPVWSRDGRTLFYVSNHQGPGDVYSLDLRGPSAANGRAIRVTTGMGAQSIDFSADGTRMVYVAYASTANVWAMPIPSRGTVSYTGAVPVTTGNQAVEGIRVSPDGRWLVYDSNLGGNSDVYRVPISGGDAERLTRGPADEFRGVLSPDGRELAYHSFQTGARNIFLRPVGLPTDGPALQLTRSEGQPTMPNWSPDGSALAFFDMNTSRILVMRRDRLGRWGEPRYVGGHGWRAEWSPDGRTIAFISPTDGRIAVVPADSGRQRDIYVPGDGDPLAELAVFAASGRELYFKSHDAEGRASFWIISASGGKPRVLVRFDDPARSSNRFDFASDGRRFYFSLEDRQSDIWVADIADR